MDLDQLLNQLSDSAAELKKEAETLDPIIASVEKKLRDLDLGLEVWLRDRPLRSRELSVSASNVAPVVLDELGFARHGPQGRQSWRLLLREAEYTPNATGEEQLQLARILSVKPLQECSRDDRVRALAAFPELIAKLTAAAREGTRLIRESRDQAGPGSA